MWLPKPIYEALPAAYVVTGILFILGAGYLGLGHGAAPAYAAIGVVAVGSGLYVQARRFQARRQQSSPPEQHRLD